VEAEFCVEALNEAIYKFGAPEIMNTDQGSQFTSFDWTDRLKRAKTKITMDGKARYLDNIFIERLWRSLWRVLKHRYRGKRPGVDKTWGSCGPSAVCDGKSTIKDGSPCDGYSVSPFGRPPHPSAFSHAGIGNVID